MKLSKSYFFTLREDVKDEDSKSGNLLVRSGMIKKVSSGIYMFLPFGLRVLDKIRYIVKDEMDKAGAQELLMPSLIPREVYDTCGRTEAFGNDMFNLNDRYEKPYVLGPTHEELFTIAAKSMVQSYKDLHFTLYQQADKFRDETRPRFGLIRVREFIMKDAYSFDKDEAGLDESYAVMKKAYNNIYDRLGLEYRIVKADTGAMGGTLSEEYQAVTDIGEDTLVLCDKCDYAVNMEVAGNTIIPCDEEAKKMELVETPHQETIEDVCNYLKLDVKKSVKALLMNVSGELVAFFVRGDRSLNENKVCKLFGVSEFGFADDELISKSNAVPGYTGPVDLNCRVVVDKEVLAMKNFCCGANKKGYHYINANVSDIKYDMVEDISNVVEGDTCPCCSGKIYFKKGIEVGNLFKLGTKYAEKLGLTYLDENNKECVVTMGSYGIGVGRIMAAIVEQNNDDNGIIFPEEIAPYKVSIIIVNMKDEVQVRVANELYDKLTSLGVEVMLDDRDLRAGVKFKDTDLIGIPYRIVVGKGAVEGMVEYKKRIDNESINLSVDEVVGKLND